jgi:uncharacterized protein
VAHGTPIDAPLLRRIELAEADLRALGYRRVRVRFDGRSARIEVDPEEVARLLQPEESEKVRTELRARGFTTVRMDPQGYKARASA